MTGTEMFDAIAHIDEDLIEGCLARMKARASERRALAAAEALTENEKKSSPFKRAALTFGAIAAAVVIMLGLISILHIGGKSPQPVGPVVTDSPAPTESATEAPTEEPTPILTPVDTFAEEILSVPVKWYSYDELFANPALGNEMTYLESIEDMEMVHYSPDAFLITDDGEIAIVDTVGARLCVYDLASGQLKKSVPVGQILEADPVRAAKYGGVYYVLIPYSDSRIVAVYPDGTTSEIPVPQLQGMLEYCRVSEYYAEDGRLILTLIGPDLIMTKAVSLSDGSVTSLYSTQWTLENDTFTVTRNGMIWSFPAEPSSGVRSTRIDVLKVGENGELYVIQEVPIEGQDDMGLYQIYDKDGRLLRCEKIDYFMDSYMTADGGRIVGPDDHLYEMHCDEDAVRIIRIVPAEQTAGTEPTEVPTPEPTEQPTDEPAAQTDTDALRAFFELADENGVKNGKKLFPYYDPNNKRSWSNPRMDPAALSWDENGNLTGIILNACYDISSDCELAGELDLRGFAELTNIKITNTVAVRIINVSDCPKLERFEAYGKYDELYFSAARPPENFSFSPKNMLECRFTEMSDVVLLAPNDFACTPCFWGFRNQGDESTRMFIGCDVSNPYTFEGWYDAGGEFYSAESTIPLAEAEPPAGGDWILAARSKDKEPYYREYEGTLPSASDMLVSLENGVPAEFDIDFDGLTDTVTASMTEYGVYDREFAVTIVRGAAPNEPFTYSIRGASDLFAVYVMDCDITDERLDIIFSAGGDIAQQIESLHAFRVDPEGEGILDICFKYGNGEIFTGSRGMFAERGVFDPTEGIPVMVFTDLLDTQGIVGRFTVTNEGLMLISPFSFDPDGPDTRYFRKLKRSMEVTVMENGLPGEKITLKKGQVFAAYQTNLWDWVDLILEDGRIVRAELDTRYGGYLINGIEQDEYCEMHYAG